jgi:hypothetical protein
MNSINEYKNRSYVKSMFVGHMLILAGILSGGLISAIGGTVALYACISHFRDSRKRIEIAKEYLESMKSI